MVLTYARLLAAACAFATTATAVTPIEVKGKDFVNSKTGDRFQILGVDYQPGGSSGFDGKKDPLSDSDACLRDAALLQRLGVNTVRVYNLAPDADHDECVSIFNAAGIYLVLDVNSPLYPGYIDRTAPWTTYTTEYYGQVFGVIEAFKNYPNTLAFFAGNEVINEDSVEDVPRYMRAVQNDMKEYISKHLDRTIPVGYSAADVRPILMDTLNYFMCKDEDAPNSGSDFFGLNSYSWCGNSSVAKAGYDVLTDDFRDSSIPVFFSEYGCNAVKPRYFTEVEALYSDEMTQSFSGGLIYEYTQEDNEFGLVQLNDNGTVTLLVDYDNLMIQYSDLDMDKIQASNATQTSAEPVTCSASLIKNGTFSDNFKLPKRIPGLQKLIDDGLSNPNVGKLVDIKSQDIPQTVYNHLGERVTGIRLNVLASGDSNIPGAHTSGTTESKGSSNASTGSSGDDKKSAAGMISPFTGLVMGVAALLAVSLL